MHDLTNCPAWSAFHPGYIQACMRVSDMENDELDVYIVASIGMQVT